ncbi:ARM REPEAT PROTEIN INTERACTING WITH ABF2 [Glycine soja]
MAMVVFLVWVAWRRVAARDSPSSSSSSSRYSLVHSMELQRRPDQCLPERKGQKRKLEEEFDDDPQISPPPTGDARDALLSDVKEQVSLLDSTFSWNEPDRAAAKRATHALADLAKNEEVVNVIVEGGAIPALVKHLQVPPLPLPETDRVPRPMPFEHEVEKGSAFALGLLAVKPEHQQLIVDSGALKHLVDLLKRHKNGLTSRAINSLIRRAADAITNLAHENSSIKTRVRKEGGIPPLVHLLEFADTKVQRAAAGALRTLAFKNDENKNQIVECNALPTLILMLCSEDAAIHYEAVGVIGNLVHSSPDIKKEVLLAGALQPVIGLLSSCCSESQREAALLLGQFAATDSDCKVHIVQRGAVRPLIEMLQSSDVQLKEMSAFALGRLAQDTHNQAGIAHNGGLMPLLKLLDSKNGSLQHNAAFALYGLADNEDNVSDFIRVGGIQRLQDGEFIVQATKDCVAKTLKRLEEKIHGRVLNHLLYLMRVSEKAFQRRVALTLAHLCSADDQRKIFIDYNGLELLMGLLGSYNPKQQLDGAVALCKLANKAMTLSPVDAAPPSPTPQVYLGEQYVNNVTLSDANDFMLTESASLHLQMHFVQCLMVEKEARDIEIPNIRWEVFEPMMRFIYTGSVDITLDIAQDLLRAADQYLLEGLKRLCEYTIAQDISLENVSSMYELSEAFNAISLRHTCILFILEHYDKLSGKPGHSHLIQRIIPEIQNYFVKALTKANSNILPQAATESRFHVQELLWVPTNF